MAGKHTVKLQELVDNLSRQNTEQHQGVLDLGLQLAIYQAAMGALPPGLVSDVTREMNKVPEKAATFPGFLAQARAIAVRLLQKAKEESEAGATPEPSRSPYSATDAGASSPPPALDIVRTIREGTVPQSSGDAALREFQLNQP